ncbi:beta-lactamase [Capronia coronata CBS 617.96]|uniref:Beta-lactamase n=1 Tax=Capronia coronata CBS 617.96 TaxID=1182541 RepID=W9YNJ2_9EURO|nr:beta-lactamase [Capronia coronata CBS 617.96]EXJ94477.1 beta-lactamase [Capronia coronata CBS 617.96]
MSQVQGHLDPRFESLRPLFQSFLDSGEELGASIAVNLNGENVVDVWGGYADTARTRPWEKDTIANVWSTGKTIIGLIGLILASQKKLDLDESVSTYWPEFAANGKQSVKVRHVMSHTSGVCGWDTPVTIQELCEDFEGAAAKLAAQAPWWEPGTASGYHSLTMGFLVGKLVRCITGTTMKDFLASQVAGPLGADFQFGAKEEDWHRVSDVVPPPPPPPQPATSTDTAQGEEAQKSISMRTLVNPMVGATNANTEMWRRAELGAANGHGNARSVARLLSLVTLGGKDPASGREFLSREIIDRIFEQQCYGTDLVVKQKIRFGIGFGLTGADTEVHWLPRGRVCFWGGWGGSIGVMDLDRGITFAYVMNKMDNVGLGNQRTKAYVKAIYDALEKAS